MKKYLVVASIFGALAIILGAFGAHTLKNTLSESSLASFETGVRYQMYHAIVLLFVNSYSKFSLKQLNRINVALSIGVFLFSGSIFAIAFGIPAKFIWFVTPLGGLLLILGWVFMLLSFLKRDV
ncbi:MAG: DUF423 domain-containing protein [Lutibacter sp.]|nr:DUF423 domain-containing protein [Lutibacter sp.]MBP9600437.1 DUF423 domain-containing protein [Lutibacter sp.]